MSELDLYRDVQRYLNLSFLSSVRPQPPIALPLVAITAQAGGPGSGKWSRPDLALVHLWRHTYSPSYSLDLYGFEVKTDPGCDLTGVHEALAHTRSVHYSYLTWEYPSKNFDTKDFKIIFENCEAYGIGLISFSKDDAHSFQIHINSKRAEPDPALVDEFIDTRFDESQKQRLLDFPQTDHRR